MMSDCLKNFFDTFGVVTQQKTYGAGMPVEEVATDMAEQWQDQTKPGQGMFFDFSQNPELEEPLLNYLIKGFGWKLEKTYFIRKPL